MQLSTQIFIFLDTGAEILCNVTLLFVLVNPTPYPDSNSVKHT
jgi:hypothetical protein